MKKRSLTPLPPPPGGANRVYEMLARHEETLRSLAFMFLWRRALRWSRKGRRVDVDKLLQEWEKASPSGRDPRRWQREPRGYEDRLRKLATLSLSIRGQFESVQWRTGSAWPTKTAAALFEECLAKAGIPQEAALEVAKSLAPSAAQIRQRPQRLADVATARFWAHMGHSVWRRAAASSLEPAAFRETLTPAENEYTR